MRTETAAGSTTGRADLAEYIRLRVRGAEADRKLGALLDAADVAEALRDGDRIASAGRGGRDRAKVAAALAAMDRDMRRPSRL